VLSLVKLCSKPPSRIPPVMMKRPKKIMAHLRECSTTFSGKPDFSSAFSMKGDDLDIHFDSHFTHESWVSSTRVTIEKEQNIKDGQRNSPPKSPKNLYFHIPTLLKTPKPQTGFTEFPPKPPAGF